MWMIAGLPGKLKSLMDRLTATRAANLDNLNATVSSRAPAATALSNAVWTDTRAAKLDGIERAITAKAITSIVPVTVSTLVGGGTSTIVDISGQGVLNLATGTVQSSSATGTTAGYLRVTIDGVVVTGSSVAASNYSIAYSDCVGSYSSTGVAFDQVPFYSSLKIEVVMTSLGSGGGGKAVYAYRRSG